MVVKWWCWIDSVFSSSVKTVYVNVFSPFVLLTWRDFFHCLVCHALFWFTFLFLFTIFASLVDSIIKIIYITKFYSLPTHLQKFIVDNCKQFEKSIEVPITLEFQLNCISHDDILKFKILAIELFISKKGKKWTNLCEYVAGCISNHQIIRRSDWYFLK